VHAQEEERTRRWVNVCSGGCACAFKLASALASTFHACASHLPRNHNLTCVMA
jgi:hypothetical protein